MIAITKFQRSWVLGVFLSSTLLMSCQKDDVPDPEPYYTEPKASSGTIVDLDWDSHSNGEYPQSIAERDFGGKLSNWNSRVTVEDNYLKVKLLANELSGSGGIVSNADLPAGTEYEVSYDVRFPSDFEWGRGGKLGFGFRIGDGNTGCDKADDGNGGSARIMWYTDDDGVTKFKPYFYYKDMPDSCGDNLVSSAVFPKEGSLQKNEWYNIKMRVKSNSGSDKDGHIKVSIDDQVVLDEDIRWTTNDSKRLIDRLAFSTFRGGSQDHWMVDHDTYIHLDNLKVEKLQ